MKILNLTLINILKDEKQRPKYGTNLNYMSA